MTPIVRGCLLTSGAPGAGTVSGFCIVNIYVGPYASKAKKKYIWIEIDRYWGPGGFLFAILVWFPLSINHCSDKISLLVPFFLMDFCFFFLHSFWVCVVRTPLRFAWISVILCVSSFFVCSYYRRRSVIQRSIWRNSVINAVGRWSKKLPKIKSRPTDRPTRSEHTFLFNVLFFFAHLEIIFLFTALIIVLDMLCLCYTNTSIMYPLPKIGRIHFYINFSKSIDILIWT